MRNLQEQNRNEFCYQKLFQPSTVLINWSSDLKNFANSQPSASNLKCFSWSLDQFLFTVDQSNFWNKIPFWSAADPISKSLSSIMGLTATLLHFSFDQTLSIGDGTPVEGNSFWRLEKSNRGAKTCSNCHEGRNETGAVYYSYLHRLGRSQRFHKSIAWW